MFSELDLTKPAHPALFDVLYAINDLNAAHRQDPLLGSALYDVTRITPSTVEVTAIGKSVNRAYWPLKVIALTIAADLPPGQSVAYHVGGAFTFDAKPNNLLRLPEPSPITLGMLHDIIYPSVKVIEYPPVSRLGRT